jgi:threonine/homoserine/homoserine lactone efflux protein
VNERSAQSRRLRGWTVRLGAWFSSLNPLFLVAGVTLLVVILSRSRPPKQEHVG